MSIQIKFFASLREQVGMFETSTELAEGACVSDVWNEVTGDIPMPANTLMAVNMEYVDADQTVTDGDEVAFFPPVTGG